GADARCRRATLSGTPLRRDRRQAAHPRGHEKRVARAADDGLCTAGPLRVRSRQYRQLSTGRHVARLHWRSRQPSPRGISLQPQCRMRGKGATMKATQRLHELGQSLWLDNITREMLVNGTLRRYIDDFEITGLTSNPTIFDHAIRNGHLYDDSIRRKAAAGKTGEDLFIDLALEDLTQAADLFRPAH